MRAATLEEVGFQPPLARSVVTIIAKEMTMI